MSRLQKASIPNFFMPPKDLEQSMRSLRLAATFRKQPRQDHENERKKRMQDMTDHATFRTKGKVLTKSFVDWKKLEEMRTTGEVPLTSEETSRLARIFSSNYSTKK
jgi:transposase